jgi:hypothetical protein
MTARRRGSKKSLRAKRPDRPARPSGPLGCVGAVSADFPARRPGGAAERLAADSIGLEVHILDVGQGSSALVLTPAYAALIDGGEVGMGAGRL